MIGPSSIFVFCLVSTAIVSGQVRHDLTAKPQTIPLWENGAPGAQGQGDNDKPTLTIYLPWQSNLSGTSVIVAPGGGYEMLADNHEGRQVANWFNAMGVTAFVLKYRLGPRYHHPIELGDAQRAIRLVRSRAKEFEVSPDRIGMMGFSAGGHLASTAATPLSAHLIEANVLPAVVMRAAHAGPAFIKQPLFNTVQGYDSYVVPASTGLIVHQLLIIAICLVMGTWIERGGWAVAPRGRLSVCAFGGMILAFWLLAWCAILFWVGFVFWFHDLPRAGNLGAAIAVGALYGLAIAALGVSLGCWMADRERAFQVVGAVSIPMLFLSGFAFPIESIPEPVVWVSFLLPSTHGIQALLKFNQMGATWLETAPQIIRLLIVTAAYLGLAWWMASRRATGSDWRNGESAASAHRIL